MTIFRAILLALVCIVGAASISGQAKDREFACTPTAVWDGDGPIWCAEGPRIRLAGVAAREIDETCRRGHPCPAASAIAARSALVDLLGGAKGRLASGHIKVRYPAMACITTGASYGRTVATCRIADGRDLAQALIATGTVLPWDYRPARS